jgi:hypothetical protein
MAKRVNFTEGQRQSAFTHNAAWLRDHKVDGIDIAQNAESLRAAGCVYYCENCLFCHDEQQYFDVDHLVPDQNFKLWGKHLDARAPENMVILCKSLVRGDLGCNQSKWANQRVPRQRGLAYTRSNLDMNCYPVNDRPFEWT